MVESPVHAVGKEPEWIGTSHHPHLPLTKQVANRKFLRRLHRLDWVVYAKPAIGAKVSAIWAAYALDCYL